MLLSVLLTMLFVYQADVTIVNVATPSIQADLGASGAEIELVVGGYLLASAAAIITGARLGHMYGYRRVFLAGLGVFGVSSLACGLAPDAGTLIVARVVQGIGGALAFPQVLSGIQHYIEDGPRRVRALGLYAATLAGGASAGQILGGLFVSADLFGLGWRPIFLVNVPVLVVALVAGRVFLPADAPTDPTRRLDLTGAAVLTAAVLLIVVPLTLGREAGWPAWTWLCFAAGAPTIAGFVAVERRQVGRGRTPLVHLQVIRRPRIAWGLLSQALAVVTYYSLLFTIAHYLQDGLGRSALASGLMMLPWVIAFGIPGRLLGRVPAHARRFVPAIGCLILGTAHGLVSIVTLTGNTTDPVLLALLAMGGFGLGTAFSSTLTHLTTEATRRYAADLSGVFTTILQISGAIGIAVFGTVYLALVDSPGPAPADRAFGVVTAALACLALAAGVVAYLATARWRGGSAEAAQPQAVGDHEHRGERHRGTGEHRVEQAGGS